MQYVRKQCVSSEDIIFTAHIGYDCLRCLCMEKSETACYKSNVAAMSSFFWVCCKERQKKGRLALNNKEHFFIDGDSSSCHLYFSGKTADRMRAQMSGISGHGMASEKTPGSDGLPCEFYKVFWNDLAEILLNALIFSFETGQLSISQRRGFVKLIPKKDAKLFLIKNWRPLTLLNCDYKIASKAIASRIKTFLPKLISDDQTGVLVRIFVCWTVSSNIQKEETFRAFFFLSILRKLLIH